MKRRPKLCRRKSTFWWLYFDKNQMVVGILRIILIGNDFGWINMIDSDEMFCPLGGPPSRTSPFYLIDTSIGVIRNQSTFISLWLREKCLKMKLLSLRAFRRRIQMIVLTRPSIHHQKSHGYVIIIIIQKWMQIFPVRKLMKNSFFRENAGARLKTLVSGNAEIQRGARKS